MTIRITLNLRPLGSALAYMGEETRNFAIRDALNRSMDAMFTTGKRAIGREANITVGDIGRALHKFPAAGGSMQAEVRAIGKWMAASYKPFAARQNSTGAAFTPWKGHREQVDHGFIATMKSGHQSIFVRINGNKHLKIGDVGWGPNVAREMVREDHGHTVPKEMQERAQAVFATRFAYQYERVVAKAKAQFGL